MKTTIEKFWSNISVKSADECWLWKKCTDKDGYGKTTIEDKDIRVHRYAYYLSYGSLRKNLMVLHTCDNRLCCNPNHLYQGTALQNAKDRDTRGRSIHPKGEKHGNFKLLDIEVQDIRFFYEYKLLSRSQLAKIYGVHYMQITHIVRYEQRI